jgi:hypothetical protein
MRRDPYRNRKGCLALLLGGVALVALGLYTAVHYPNSDGSVGPLGVLLILIGLLTVFITIIVYLYGAL